MTPMLPVHVRRPRKPFMLFPAFWPWLILVCLMATGVYFFHGFTVPVLAAAIIAITTWPVYKKLLHYTGHNNPLAATIAILTAIVFIVAPLVFTTVYAVKEVAVWLAWAVEANKTGVATPDWIMHIPYTGEWLAEKWTSYFSHPGVIGEIAEIFGSQSIGTLYRNVLATSGMLLHILLTLTFILITLFFLYKDGNIFVRQLDRAGEFFYPNRWHRYSRVIPVAIKSTVLGMGLIAVGEGIILGIAYWIAGVPSPVTLGVLTGFMALIPGGAPLSFTLVSIYLISTQSTIAGVSLFVWGCVELFMVDKFLRPRLVGRPMQLPFLPTFFGLIGGVKTMGFLGLFIGPALMAILVMIWREFIQEIPTADPDEPLDVSAGD